MTDLKLRPEEGIILKNESVFHNEEEEEFELYLTNLNLIYVEEVSKGFFSKMQYNVLKYPLNEINTTYPISVFEYEGYWSLQILFKSGMQKFGFYSTGRLDKLKKKVEVEKWANRINELIGVGVAVEDSKIVGGIKSVLGAVGIKQKTAVPEKTMMKCVGCMATLSGMKGQTVVCRYCDTEQIL